MSDVRKRNVPNGVDSKTTPKSTTTPTKSDARFKATDILRILGGLLLLNAAISYFVTSNSVTWGYRPWWSKPRQLSQFLVSTTPVSHDTELTPTVRSRAPHRRPASRVQRRRRLEASLHRAERYHLRRLGRPPRIRSGRLLLVLRGPRRDASVHYGLFRQRSDA